MAFEYSTLVSSAVRTTNGNSGAIGPVGADNIGLGVNVTAASGTTPSLALSVEWSYDAVNFGPGEVPVTFAAITGVKTTNLRTAVQAPFFRLVWALTGTTPSFTFSASRELF